VTEGPDALRVWFDHAEGLSASGKTIQGFQVASEDHRFFPAEATLDGETAVVRSASMPRPLRALWLGQVVPRNFYNGAKMPASTFTSEKKLLH